MICRLQETLRKSLRVFCYFFPMVILFLAFSYALLVGLLWYGWLCTPECDVSEPNIEGVSVIVAMRNEEQNIGNLLRCLAAQQWDKPMQVIVVDDHSEDNSAAEASSFAAEFPFELSVVPGSGSGKKAALALGVGMAKFPVILTTDADCRMGNYWVRTMCAALCRPGTRLVTGPVKIAPTRTWMARFQALETAALIGSTAAFIRWNMPNMGNGANMGYWRDVFFQTGGYQSSQEIASGDDEFLIQQVHDLLKGGVRFVKASEAVVATAPQPDWRALLMQRKRWAAKWRKNRPFRVWGVALSVGIYNLFWAILPFVALVAPHFFAHIIAAFSLKLAAEYVFLNAVLRLLQQKTLIRYIFPLQLFYAWYVVLTGMSATRGGFIWKGRTFIR